jgi:hypothetical protein
LIPQRSAVQFCGFWDFFDSCFLDRVKMKKRILLGLAGMMFVSTAANAISVTGQAGEHYTNLASVSGLSHPVWQ